MKLFIGVPTLSRADLLNQFYRDFCLCITGEDRLVILDNGGSQNITLPASANVEIRRMGRNLGVSASWNYLLREAFVRGSYQGCVLLQDDIIWSDEQLQAAKRLLAEQPDIDLFLSFSQFSVQVHRPGNLRTIGFYDERFSPAWNEDDDYALRMIQAKRIYQRFHDLDPLPGSLTEGTEKESSWQDGRKKLREKWGDIDFGVNFVEQAYYETNRHLLQGPVFPLERIRRRS